MKPWIASLLALWFTIISITDVGACAVMARKYDLEVYLQADAVIRAKVIGYHYDVRRYTSYFDIKNIETLRGHVRDGAIFSHVAWTNSTFPMPKKWIEPNIIVGLEVHLDEFGKPAINVVQQGCNPRFILADTPKNRRLIRQDLQMIGFRLMLERSKRYYAGTAVEKQLDLRLKSIEVPDCSHDACSPDMARVGE